MCQTPMTVGCFHTQSSDIRNKSRLCFVCFLIWWLTIIHLHWWWTGGLLWWQGVTLSYYCTSGHFPFKASSDRIFYTQFFVVNVTELTINFVVVCFTNVLKICTFLTVFVSLSIKKKALYNEIKTTNSWCSVFSIVVTLFYITVQRSQWFSWPN